MNRRERRAAMAEVRAVTDEGGAHTVTLHCIRPGVVDDYGSLWMADTFDESLATRLPTLCWTHDWSDPLGRGVDFRTSDQGPEVICEFDDFDAVPQARRAYAQVKSGTIADCSVGFSNTKRRDPTDEELRQYPGIREVITKADLDEISLVLRGAVPGAKVLAVRSPEAVIPAETAAQVLARLGAGEIDLADALQEIKAAASDGEPGGGKTAEQIAAEEAEEAARLVAEAELEADIDETLALLDRG